MSSPAAVLTANPRFTFLQPCQSFPGGVAWGNVLVSSLLSWGSDSWTRLEFYCCPCVVQRQHHVQMSLGFSNQNGALPCQPQFSGNKTKPKRKGLFHTSGSALCVPLCKLRIYFRAWIFVFVFGTFRVPEYISLNRSTLFPEKWTHYSNRKPLFTGACAPALSVAPLRPLVATPIPWSQHNPEESNPGPDFSQVFLSFFPPWDSASKFHSFSWGNNSEQ